MDDPDTAGNGAPAGSQNAARYDRDLYGWAIERAALLRAGRLTEVDALNIAEEIDDVGDEQYNKLESALRVILLHLLKWDYQPERRSRSWTLSIAMQPRHVLRCCGRAPASRLLSTKPLPGLTRPRGLKRSIAQTLLEEDMFRLNGRILGMRS